MKDLKPDIATVKVALAPEVVRMLQNAAATSDNVRLTKVMISLRRLNSLFLLEKVIKYRRNEVARVRRLLRAIEWLSADAV